MISFFSSRSFRGGIHPPDNKQWTKDKPVEEMPAPARVVIPMQQHTGAQCEPVVSVGDVVKEGQKIGASKGFVSSPVHASISGKVTSIAPHPHPVLPKQVLSVTIEGDGSPSATWTATTDWKRMGTKEIIDRIEQSGIVGLGGAAFPTHVKLSPPPGKKIEALILNGVECEPFLTADHRLMLEAPDKILEGILISLKTLGISKAYIGIEKNKPDAIRVMKDKVSALAKSSASIEVVPLAVKYPQGAEKQLIKAIMKREVPSGGLPFDVGVIVQNVGTLNAIFEAVVLGKPLIERVITLSGNGIKNPRNLRVRIGTQFSSIIEYTGGLTADVPSRKIIMGGPMMGLAQYTLDVPVIKGTSGILVFDNIVSKQKLPCVKCGHCVSICPMSLMPYRLGEYSERNDFDLCKEYRVADCMECGACTYTCPSARQLVHLIKYAKFNINRREKA